MRDTVPKSSIEKKLKEILGYNPMVGIDKRLLEDITLHVVLKIPSKKDIATTILKEGIDISYDTEGFYNYEIIMPLPKNLLIESILEGADNMVVLSNDNYKSPNVNIGGISIIMYPTALDYESGRSYIEETIKIQPIEGVKKKKKELRENFRKGVEILNLIYKNLQLIK